MLGLARRIARKLRAAPPAAPAAAPVHHQLTVENYQAIPREAWHHYDEPTLPKQPGGIAVPNFALRANSAGGGDLGYWFGIGDAWAHALARLLPPSPTVLDLGCGCGKLARFLALLPDLRYVGVDIFQPHILWCRRAFAELGDRFSFHHFDGYSEEYNPGGAVQTVDYALPVDDGSVDVVAAHSLFTHLLEPEARHYLREIARVLRPDGRAVISLHTDTPPGVAYVEHHSGAYVTLDYFTAMAADAGLALRDNLGVIYGQTVAVFGRS